MGNDSSKSSDKAVDGGVEHRSEPDKDQADAEESLSEALNGLEQILVHRQRGPSRHGPERDARPPTPHPDAQYTIPLLHDVVVPSGDGPPGPVSGTGERNAPQPGIDEEELCRRLSERLANEIEVIVQARVEAAVQEAAEDIREQVRNHLEIMLPEIIEELNVITRRQGR